jgi:hypothetical protein
VGAAADRVAGAGLSLGLSERPVRSGATFSIRRSLDEMQRYGYHDPRHGAGQRRARDRGWLDEQMFVRFRLLREDGTGRADASQA